MRIRLISVLLFELLTACTTNPFKSGIVVVDEIAASAKMTAHLRPAGVFVLTTRERIGNLGEDVTIYIEGDGSAWLTRSQLSYDPTPDDPVALRLAALDHTANVAWIARPCQYTRMTKNTQCKPLYWTGGRFAPEVVESIDAAISAIKRDAESRKVHLVGYSGGGGIAALVAAQRRDVATLRTVAGNLDHRAFTAYHGVSPMTDSLNPADVAKRLQALPQLHLVGGRDRIIPELVAQAYLSRMDTSKCVLLRRVSSATHQHGWDTAWQDAVRSFPECQKP